MESMSAEKLAILETEHKTVDDANKLRVNEIRVATNGLRFLFPFPSESHRLVRTHEIEDYPDEHRDCSPAG
jgi:hypothetical protein